MPRGTTPIRGVQRPGFEFQAGDTPFVMTQNAVETIIDLVEKTEQTGLEHGFNFCELPQTQRGMLEAGTTCKGDVCSVNLSDTPCKQGKQTGSIHTHPDHNPKPSANDMAASLYEYLNGKSGPECRAVQTKYAKWVQCDLVDSQYTNIKLMLTYAAAFHELDKLTPLYEEWKKTGVQPQLTPALREANNESISLLESVFTFGKPTPL